MRRLIKKINLLFSSLLLALFYIFAIPVGKLIFNISHLAHHKRKKSYWLQPTGECNDLSSPY